LNSKLNFAIIGVAGYVAPKHLQAIFNCGHQVVAAYDKNDSVGILDQYFPDTSFFTEFERFDRHLEKLRISDRAIDYLIVCSPNYLHDAHIRYGLRYGANVICEKPLVLNPWNLETLLAFEENSKKRVFNILQLRLHPSIIQLKKEIEESPINQKHEVDLTYITSRGKWYYASWKGDVQKSGGIATNIGIHFFDMLLWIFGPCKESVVHINNHDRASGWLSLEKANVRWFLSINENSLPENVKAQSQRTYRSIKIDDKEIEFSEGFTDLHTKSYQNILEGNGFGIREAMSSLDLVYNIRNTSPSQDKNHKHDLSSLPIDSHPFQKVK